MRKSINLKRVISSAMAVVMAASLCVIAVPAYNAEAATKKKTVTLADNGGGEKDIDMAVGAKIQLKVKKDGATLGKTAVTYKVSGKSVVSCSKSGLIKAKKAGEAEITIKDKNSNFGATVYVEVGGGSKDSKESKKKPDKIWLDKSEIWLEVGGGYHASVFERPTGIGGHTTWTSENSDIATVSDGGYIRAVGHGDVRIWAYKRGRNACMMVHVN